MQYSSLPAKEHGKMSEKNTSEFIIVKMKNFSTYFFIRNRVVRNWYWKCKKINKLLVLSKITPVELRNCKNVFHRKINNQEMKVYW